MQAFIPTDHAECESIRPVVPGRVLVSGVLSLIVAVAADAAPLVLTQAKFIESLSGGTSGDCPAGVGGTSIFAPDTIDRNCEAAGGFSSGHARTTGGNTPTIVLDLAASAQTSSYGKVDIEYEVAVVALPGAPVLDVVPVDVSAFGNVWVSKAGEYSAVMNASVYVGLVGDNAQAFVPFSLTSLGDEDGLNVHQLIDFVPGVAQTVTMGAYGEVKPRAYLPITGGAEAHAVVDPVMRIAADFALRDFFTLQFSPGILPAAEVPLPATLWLMLTGFGVCFLPRIRGARFG